MAQGRDTIAPYVRPRPPLLRALGRDEPPDEVEVDLKRYRLLRVVKHDSWAATAFYRGVDKAIVCKFNRQQRVGPIPMRWLGRWLAGREAHALRLLAGLPGIPAGLGAVTIGGELLRHAVAHDFIAGRPLGRHDAIPAAAFAALVDLLAEVHRRSMAYVDLHKRENILVGDDGRLYLLDFQISFCLPRRWPGNALPMRALLGILQRSDSYHLKKHIARCSDAGQAPARPWWIRVHRGVAIPLRALRRWLLVRLGVRTGRGRVETEFFPEEVVRTDREGRKVA
jgi:hypothetical protein